MPFRVLAIAFSGRAYAKHADGQNRCRAAAEYREDIAAALRCILDMAAEAKGRSAGLLDVPLLGGLPLGHGAGARSILMGRASVLDADRRELQVA